MTIENIDVLRGISKKRVVEIMERYKHWGYEGIESDTQLNEITDRFAAKWDLGYPRFRIYKSLYWYLWEKKRGHRRNDTS